MANTKANGRARGNGKADTGKTNGSETNGGKPKVTSKDAPGTGGPKRVQFNCLNCPGYCCSYPVITVTKYDVTRLAKYFGVSWEEAEKRFTKSQHGYKRILRKKKDEHFGTICRFFDQENRCCGIYKARPYVCRAFPGGGRCGYYDFLMFERRAQDDDEFVALTDHS
jgi:Fe-S-cluster containining protein